VGVIVIAVVGVIITAIWYGTRLSFLTITTVKAEGGETIDSTSVERLVEETLDGTFFGLVPRRFSWFYPEEEVLAKLATVERIHNIQIILEESTALHILYDEYVPQALWCQSATEESCFFLDTTGYAFGQAPKLSGGTFLRFVTVGREPAVGEKLAELAVYEDTKEVVRLLTEQGWFTSHIEIDQVGDVFLKMVGGGELKVNLDEEPAMTVENLRAVLASDEFKHLTPGNFQYVDLRFGNKVFVNEELVTEVQSTSTTVEATTSQGVIE